MKTEYDLFSTLALSDANAMEYFLSHTDECLQLCMEDDKIYLDGVKTIIMNACKKKILDNYRGSVKKLNGETDKRYYIWVKDDLKKDGRKKLRAPTEEELLEKVYEWYLEQNKTPTTLAAMHDEFLEHKKSTTWSIATVTKNESIWNNHYVGNPIINVPLQKITLKQLKEWAYSLIRDHDLTRKEWGNVSTWMKQMMEYAIEQEYILSNPYLLLKITNRNVFRVPEVKEDENRVLAPDEELALYRVCMDYFHSKHYPTNRFLPLSIIMLFQLGVRPCEVCTLRFDDIRNDKIIIRRYYSKKQDAVMENRTKAGHGQRSIYLTSLASNLIDLIRQTQVDTGYSGQEYIFITDNSIRGFYNRLRKTIPAICKKAGIPRNTAYSGKRTFVSSLVDENVNIRTIQNYVGRNDSKTTFNNYCFDRKKASERKKSLEHARLSLTLDELNGGSPTQSVP